MSVKIEHRVGIAAPADRVWEVLTDFARWGEWNAVHPQIAGRLAMGAVLDVAEQIDARAPQRLVATVQDWEPNNQILWTTPRGPLATSLRFIEIEALSETACIFANGEVWSGLLGSRIGKGARRARRAAYAAMAEALKARVEALEAPRLL